MKFFLLVLFCLMYIVNGFSQRNPEKGRLAAGAKLQIGSYINSPGIGLRAMRHFSQQFQLSVGFNYYLPSEDIQKTKETHSELSEIYANLEVTFGEGRIRFYPIAGLNMAFVSESVKNKFIPDSIGNNTSSINKRVLGLNMGLGLRMIGRGRMIPFLEAYYTAGNYPQAVIGMGFLYRIGWR